MEQIGGLNIYKGHRDPKTKCFLQHLRTDSFLVSPVMGMKPKTVTHVRECAPEKRAHCGAAEHSKLKMFIESLLRLM